MNTILDTHAYSDFFRGIPSIFLQLRRHGVGIPTNDLWIAALAVQHDLDLCTSDAHFEKVDGLRIC